MERKMKKNIKMAILVAFLGVFVACSSESTPTYSELGSDNYPQKFYVEYVPCTYGANWSPEAFNQDMLPGWQELLVEVDSTIVAAYGLTYEGEKPEDAPGDGFWQLIWNSKADADAGWETWESYEKTADWFLKTHKILKNNHYKAYEISNFSKINYECKHNLHYWNINPYIGYGPSAHSFDGHIRWSNIKSLDCDW